MLCLNISLNASGDIELRVALNIFLLSLFTCKLWYNYAILIFLTEDEGEKDEEKENSSQEGDAIKEDIIDDAEENVQGRSILTFGLRGDNLNYQIVAKEGFLTIIF